jgi:hypothetical protein
VNPAPFQRTAVSEPTTIGARFYPDQNVRARTQRSWSKTPSFGLGGFGSCEVLPKGAVSMGCDEHGIGIALSTSKTTKQAAPKRLPGTSIRASLPFHSSYPR